MTTLTAISSTRIDFTDDTITGSWDASRPVGQRFATSHMQEVTADDVSGFLHALAQSDVAGAAPAHRLLLGEIVHDYVFTEVEQVRQVFGDVLRTPQVCFDMLNTAPSLDMHLHHSAVNAPNLFVYLVRLAIYHGFLHVIFAEDLLEAVEYYHAEKDLSDSQAADLLMMLLVLTPTQASAWDNRHLATFVSLIALVLAYDHVMVTEDEYVLPWILHTAHEGAYFGIPYQPTTEPPALHRDVPVYLLLAFMARFAGISDLPASEQFHELVQATQHASWHTRVMSPMTVGFLVRLWAVSEWLTHQEPDATLRIHTLTALAHTNWHTQRSPEQVSIHATTAHTAATLGWDIPRTLHALALIDDIGPTCTLDDMVHVIEYLDSED